jgi:hypothetical protein
MNVPTLIKLRETVEYESNTIKSSTYQFDKKDLLIEFVSGSKYYYEGVEHDDYLSFSTAESVGKSFIEYIKKYNGKKIEENA